MMTSYSKLYELVKRSKLVNAKWYKERYKDVSLLGMDPIEHYLKYGGALRRNPCKRFDADFYIAQVPEIKNTNENPLVHYLLKGRKRKEIRINPSQPDVKEFELKDRVVAHLWGGHSAPALKALECVYLDPDNDTRLRGFAAWHAARWFYFVGDFEKALNLAGYIREMDKKLSQEKRFVMLYSFCYQELGKFEEAKNELLLYLRNKPKDTDALLALSNTSRSDEEKLACINAVYGNNSLKKIRKIDNKQPLSLDNIVCEESSDVNREWEGEEAKISVIMPIYNASKNIDTAIRGLLCQTWRNIEIIAVDDRSTDDTYEKLLSWAARDSRVKPILQSKNGGAYAARNLGLSHATGDYITTHDSDDWSHSEKIETQMSYLKNNPQVKGVVTYWVRARKSLVFTQNWRLNSELVHWSHSSFLFGSDVLKDIGGWDLVNVGGDTEFIWRIESAFGTSAVKKIQKTIPFSFALDDETSLTRTKSTHVKTIHYGLRHIYRASCKWWHKSKGYTAQLDYGLRKNFPAPKTMYERENNPIVVDMVLAGDFSKQSHCEAAWKMLARRNSVHVALFHWPDFKKPVEDLCDGYFECISLDWVEPVVVGQTVKSKKHYVLDKTLLEYELDSLPEFIGFAEWSCLRGEKF